MDMFIYYIYIYWMFFLTYQDNQKFVQDLEDKNRLATTWGGLELKTGSGKLGTHSDECFFWLCLVSA